MLTSKLNATGEKVLRHSRQMVEMLENPELGISSWHLMLGGVMRDLRAACEEMETNHPFTNDTHSHNP